MRKYMMTAMLLASMGAMPVMMGCDRTIRSSEKTTSSPDGTTTTSQQKTVEHADGSVTTEKQVHSNPAP